MIILRVFLRGSEPFVLHHAPVRKYIVTKVSPFSSYVPLEPGGDPGGVKPRFFVTSVAPAP